MLRLQLPASVVAAASGGVLGKRLCCLLLSMIMMQTRARLGISFFLLGAASVHAVLMCFLQVPLPLVNWTRALLTAVATVRLTAV